MTKKIHIFTFFWQTHLTQDPVVMVRAAYAENIAKLAETALRLKATSYSYIWTSCPTGIFNLGPYIYTL